MQNKKILRRFNFGNLITQLLVHVTYALQLRLFLFRRSRVIAYTPSTTVTPNVVGKQRNPRRRFDYRMARKSFPFLSLASETKRKTSRRESSSNPSKLPPANYSTASSALIATTTSSDSLMGRKLPPVMGVVSSTSCVPPQNSGPWPFHIEPRSCTSPISHSSLPG